ncbi:MAG TPA: DUF499 domain-containing protein [Thermomicrobiales bacterium]|nr:DUF499 domain-containing protein [Thermomicrobiales bacterium]
MIPSLLEACVPRQSVFDTNLRDTVYSLDDLASIDGRAFFAENFVTGGMRTLLTEVFSRMDGSNPDANGSFLLSQSMGGGKTHSLLALALLAQDPSLRPDVMGAFATVGDIGPVAVLSFSGRQNPQFGIWGELAEQLGRREVLARFYQPLQAPGESDWVRLLQGDRTLILIDELPPYLNQALQVTLGQSTLAHATQSALSNLLAAINSGKLPNVTLVLTDLSGSSYQLADDRLTGVLGDMEKEAERTVQPITPVRLDTAELYHILRTRLFERLPDEGAVDEVAAAFRQAIEAAGRTLDVPTDRAAEVQSSIRQTYPFHPSMQDIFARFRENQGYQQTRALIRIMRQVIAGLWESRLAGERYLIGVQDIDTANPRLASELDKINDRFTNAIAHDISKSDRSAVAQRIDGPTGRNAGDAARLVLMSSLSLATNPVLGLTRADIISALASPGREVGDLDGALLQLIDGAWYLHATAEGRLLFRSTENVRARLEDSVKNVIGDTVRTEIGKRLAELYKPTARDVYQDVQALPDLRELTNTIDRTVLIIARPEEPGSTILTDYYNSLPYKNRVLLVTSRPAEYDVVVQRTRYLIATRQMVREFEQGQYRPDDPQLLEARDLATRYDANFYQALREAFFTLRSPGRNGLLQTEFSPEYDGNRFRGEDVIRQALVDRSQYVAPVDMMTDRFRERIERELWPAESKAVAWAQIRTEAAQQPGFPMHQPAKLDDVRDQAVQRGQWRLVDEGRFVERGPFEREKARVSAPRVIGEPDPETGAVTIEVKPVNADIVRFISADGASQIVENGKITVTDLAGRFVAEDSTGAYESADPVAWENRITLRFDTHQDGNGRRVELKAVPPAPIRYTTDQSSPINSGQPYTGPIAISNAATTIRAVAEADGIRSAVETFEIQDTGGQEVTVDPRRPAEWRRRLVASSTADTFALLRQLEQATATVAGIELTAESAINYSLWQVDEGVTLTVAEVRQVADVLTTIHLGWNLRVEIARTEYAQGSDLLDIVRERKLEIRPNELRQGG